MGHYSGESTHLYWPIRGAGGGGGGETSYLGHQGREGGGGGVARPAPLSLPPRF